MKINKYIRILLCMLVTATACDNETLEDTYKDYSGEGEIRYLGKCTDLLVTPGWQRIIVNWKNNVDPCIAKIKVKWILDESKDSILLERGTTEYSINTLNGEHLVNGNYEISVSGVSVDGNTSIPSTVSGRPYSYMHEDVMAFNQVINKVFFVRDRMILFFLGWQNSLIKASLDYTKKDGSPGQLVLNEEVVNKIYYLLEGEVDPSKPLILNRKGELPGCKDVIDFEPYELSTRKTYDSDFKQEMKRQFGFEDEISEEWSGTREILYLDWSLTSLTDLLNFPNLKKVVLGSRRYLREEGVEDKAYGQSTLLDNEVSNFVLKTLKELNGLTVERYNKHFPGIEISLVDEERGNTNQEPVITCIDLSNAKLSVSPEDGSDYSSHLENLIDGDYNTNWTPLYSTSFVAYDLTFDLKSAQKINGIRFVQRQFKETAGEIAIAPNAVKVYVSNDQMSWKPTTYVEEYPLGKSQGEINYVDFTEEIKASEYRYVQVRINAGFYFQFYYSSVAEISLY